MTAKRYACDIITNCNCGGDLQMDLFRLHAYSVLPQKGEADVTDPEGGAVSINSDLKSVIDDNLKSAKFGTRTVVDFDVDEGTRTNGVRDVITDYAFGQPATAKAGSLQLARRLSSAMDHRSTPCLFILAGLRNGNRRMVTLWTFPRDEALRLRNRKSGASIQVLTDIFSQTSRLRKAAQFEGRHLRNHFLSGRVLDFQANHLLKDVADFWIGRFLLCRNGLAGAAGTRLLARAVRSAYQQCIDPDARQDIYTAVMAMRRSPHKRLSLNDFADRYLDQDSEAHQSFMGAVPNDDSASAIFEFEVSTFDNSIHFRIFALDNGVYVSSPLTEIGESVRVTGQNEKILFCSGRIVEEKLRSRHG